mmetsp:Transcript_21626/g.55064  ORF Transcript_21626/g.55064 Transcript_21626/m.55064 type:complete len:222 (-) Transcript_21626:307-972(-)
MAPPWNTRDVGRPPKRCAASSLGANAQQVTCPTDHRCSCCHRTFHAHCLLQHGLVQAAPTDQWACPSCTAADEHERAARGASTLVTVRWATTAESADTGAHVLALHEAEGCTPSPQSAPTARPGPPCTRILNTTGPRSRLTPRSAPGWAVGPGSTWALPWPSLARAVMDACEQVATELQHPMPAPNARINWLNWYKPAAGPRPEVSELALLGLHRWQQTPN